MPLPQEAITGSVKQRNARFKKSPKRGDIRWSSRGAGVVYTPKKPPTSRQLWLARVDAQARAAARNTPCLLIRNGVVVG